MRAGRLRALTTVLALAGVGIAGYLSYSRLTSVSLACPTSGCATVQRSSYAELLDIPVAYVGLLAYLLIAATALSRRRVALHAGTAVVAVGLAFSAYLLVVQLRVIGAVCTWCVASDGVMLALAAVNASRYRPAPVA